MSSNLAAPIAHPAFDLIRHQNVDSLNIRVEEYQHRHTGAVHYHLGAENSENVFLVALRTVPDDSSGVAHILEHTALCGSENYPVRDPFFMMLRRSLNTFMNAFTSSDWTAYPFASQNRKDFNNLLDVYLDAVFFSRLDPLDFAQEGHRMEFSEAGNTDSELVFKGVVFNEMKGAMSSVTSTLWDKLCEHLFPTSTYHYNSGGDPACIPDLSYEQLKEFYTSHYHPSNAIFMTFGDMTAHEHQSVFEEKALQRFDKLDQRIEVLPEKRLSTPLQVSETYAYDDNAPTDNKTHIVVAWMLGESANLEQLLEAQLLSSVLTDNSSSPLLHALETTDLGQAPSPLCGLEDSMREMVFCCGVEGSEADNAQAVEKLVLDVLIDVAENGVPQERVEAVLHQLELHQREVSGDGFPYGLQLILQALGSATHYSDPIAVLNLEPVIAGLREKIQDPDYIRQLTKKLLLDNKHRVSLVMAPDKTLSSQRTEAEAARLAHAKSLLNEEEKQAIVTLASDLAERQQQTDDESILPKVELTDVATDFPEPQFEQSQSNGLTLSAYAQGTNGIVYQQAIAALPQLSSQELRDLPFYTSFLTELGLNGASYLDAQHRQASTVGSIGAYTSLRGSVDSEQELTANFVLSSKALLNKAGAQNQLMRDTLETVHFSETSRIADLISQQRARREQSITGSGHALAMAAACAGMSPLARLNHEVSGMAGIKSLRELDESLRDETTLAEFSARLENLHQRVNSVPIQLLTVAEAEKIPSLVDETLNSWQGYNASSSEDKFHLAPRRERCGEIWLANTQVNFCARAYPTVPVQHSDAAALTVLGGVLRNGFLHRVIREQGGAYGGGASQDSGIAAFKFYSYRDPRLSETLADFDASIEWMLSTQHEYRALEEAILGVVGSLDKPGSPAGEAKHHFHNRLAGQKHEQRQLFRQRVLDVTLEDLQRVTQTYLQADNASTAVITGSGDKAAAQAVSEELSLPIHEL